MYDIIVVGARCAGSAVALLLARQGHKVLLVDRSSFPSDFSLLDSLHPSVWGRPTKEMGSFGQSHPVGLPCDYDFPL
jgi:flavin-dependent dehydrogenase